MNKKRFFILSLFLILFGVSIFSVENPSFSSFEPYHLSRNFDLNRQKYLQVIAIPYKDPMELKLGPENNSISGKNLIETNFIQIPGLSFSGMFQPFLFSVVPSEKIQFLPVSETIFANDVPSRNGKLVSGAFSEKRTMDRITDSRNQIPGFGLTSWNPNSFQNGNSSGVMFLYMKRHAGLEMDFNARMIGNQAGLAFLESARSTIAFNYSVFPEIGESSKMNFFLQFSSIKRFQDKGLSYGEPGNNFRGMKSYEYYLNPGISFSSRNLSLEGMIRVPVPIAAQLGGEQHQWMQDVQGILGIKYSFSETSSK
ncbi:hypothetical protein GS518_17740 [Leptospira interrogans]|uniref:Uncharacterized protein n=15 Tax=Leptospira interrogans TaxID=173 RepID=A0A1X8WL27_LEPIR|nr:MULTISPECIES: membrane protein [Leptospira]EMG18954.1 hypothetical protein LEP1GSC150_1255 [Leptospira interrogans serovar Copenhageni str. LT2050]EMM80960.1 hypothetical protein LEP1GSC037_3350 [Leptospira interrogans str. 2006001854]EMM93076.1 hypothetical protein LEP1GSC158_0210 [Leptospira interrogans serovar Zanoni str. LT2156]EMN30252.1 hypothetical protein LEP1GSC083_2921 [Leptospira interrogans serovar Pyrogenes str. L0374]EMN70200.1 hypothetical protein LEP1GSC100_3925 [Leptospira 